MNPPPSFNAEEAPGLPPLPRSFYERPALEVAPALLGKVLIGRVGGEPMKAARLVEVEAYLGEKDEASHARRGPTPRAAIMFGPPARLYVYLIYGMHHCMNVVCETEGVAGAVLLRAAEPLVGFADGGPARLAGPGRLCAGFGVTRAHNGLALDAGLEVYLVDDGWRPPVIERSPRIGVPYAGEWALAPLRFFVGGHQSVSGMRRTRRT